VQEGEIGENGESLFAQNRAFGINATEPVQIVNFFLRLKILSNF